MDRQDPQQTFTAHHLARVIMAVSDARQSQLPQAPIQDRLLYLASLRQQPAGHQESAQFAGQLNLQHPAPNIQQQWTRPPAVRPPWSQNEPQRWQWNGPPPWYQNGPPPPPWYYNGQPPWRQPSRAGKNARKRKAKLNRNATEKQQGGQQGGGLSTSPSSLDEGELIGMIDSHAQKQKALEESLAHLRAIKAKDGAKNETLEDPGKVVPPKDGATNENVEDPDSDE